ncbi:TetR/AcrR family transcriptional regulator [Nocardia sp. BMG111209]|uniref:TetR/AcrR family transcriptional regulator n=1 Tax=Nocardia sp. BMG111209 TaxID=1160137 RepID=UPI000380722B|nr:TetR/AcrR family transcriptional regulator [Nocardia sp. BMG111209]
MRADAERNRAAILAVAGRLICEDHRVDVSMDEIAAAADVGKGTLFRRFTDREGLIRAVFDDRTCRAWAQAREIAADPALPAAERIVAYVAAVFDLCSGLQPLLRALPESCHARTWGPWQALLADLIAEAAPEADAQFLALAVFASLRPEITAAISAPRHRAGVLALTARILGPGRR